MLRALLRRSAAATAAAVAAVGLATAPADAVADGYYQPGYTDAIYKVTGTAAHQIGYDEWVAAGRPAPKPAPTSYVKYPWSPTVYAVTFWGGPESTWLWQRLSAPQWQRAGSPAPSLAGWIKGSYYFKWATSPELFVQGEDGVIHKLTHAEWQRSGPRPFDNRSNEGWSKLTWSRSNEIARMSYLATGGGMPSTYAEWQRHDFPTPTVVSRFPGDQFLQGWELPTLVIYAGPTMSRPISFEEWTGAGRPTPSRIPPYAGSVSCAGFGSQARAQQFFEFYYPQNGDYANLDPDRDGRAC